MLSVVLVGLRDIILALVISSIGHALQEFLES